MFQHNSTTIEKRSKENFAWNSETSSRGDSSSSESDTSSEEESSEEESSEEGETSGEETQGKESSSSETESSSEDRSNLERSDEEVEKPTVSRKTSPQIDQKLIKDEIKKPDPKVNKKSNLDLLLELDNIDVAPVLTPSLGGFLTPGVPSAKISSIQVVPPSFLNTKQFELLNRLNGRGFSATYRFTRSTHLYSPSMANINIVFTNSTQENISDIRIGKKNLTSGMSMYDFASIPCIPPNCNLPATLGIDFNDSAQSANFEIVSSMGNFNVTVKPFIGELLRPVTMPEEVFLQEQSKIKGMNEHTGTIENCVDDIMSSMNENCNMGKCGKEESDYFRFAGQTLTSSNLCLVSIHRSSKVTITVNCSNVVFGSVLLNELIKKLCS